VQLINTHVEVFAVERKLGDMIKINNDTERSSAKTKI
jgi:hypothetical protein